MRRNNMGGALKLGATIGALAGFVATVAAVGLVWLIDAKEGTSHLATLGAPIAFILLGLCTGGTMLVYAARYGRSVLPQNDVIGPDEWERVDAIPEPMPQWQRDEEDAALWAAAEEEKEAPVLQATRPDAQMREVIKCIEEQLTVQYRDNQNPTRALFERNETPQPIWNTARGILRRAGFVDESGRSWAEVSWTDVSAIIDRIGYEGMRVWMPYATTSGLVGAALSDQLQAGNSYLIPPPH